MEERIELHVKFDDVTAETRPCIGLIHYIFCMIEIFMNMFMFVATSTLYHYLCTIFFIIVAFTVVKRLRCATN